MRQVGHVLPPMVCFVDQEERFRYHLGGSRKSFGDLEAGGDVGRQPRTGYDEWGADFKGTWDLGPERQLVMGLQNGRIDDAWRTHRTVFGVPWRGTTTSGSAGAEPTSGR